MDSLDLTPWIRENDGIHMPVELRNLDFSPRLKPGDSKL